MALYDSIGQTYRVTRRPDPRIAAAIHAGLGDAASVVNVGAGAGSYEPAQTVVAVEPSEVMIAQRPPGSAPAVRAVAEQLPLQSKSVDVAMGVLTVHHWSDLEAGLDQMRRVARERIVLLTWRPENVSRFWLLNDYVPEVAEVDTAMAITVEHLLELLPGAVETVVEVPNDCTDGFGAAYYGRPEAYLDPTVRNGMSMFARADPGVYAAGLTRLHDELASGEWDERYGYLRRLDSLDVGYRVISAPV